MNTIEVPLNVLNLHDDGFHLLVEVVVFHTVFRAVVDTGASRTVIDKNTIEEYIDHEHLLLSDRLSTGLGTNSMASYSVVIPEITIGDLKLQHFEAAVLDLASINHAYEQMDVGPVIGVIGGDILMNYGAIIDYFSKKISFTISHPDC
ncbi:retropepsin-like aspartic protease [Desertivirga xinjiangensis]|uniref:retropepsin-like aspartic protease n=1 Tax=Desertivirga xinjiangensis TaxID=539206 RepID=UPI0021090243|nr:retropepsin-like aspartic protease [Pedobacter xinjiangensis]